jgi:hypothetical protein
MRVITLPFVSVAQAHAHHGAVRGATAQALPTGPADSAISHWPR